MTTMIEQELMRRREDVARLTAERDALREVLYAADEYLGYYSPNSQFEPTGFGGKKIRQVIAAALNSTDGDTRR